MNISEIHCFHRIMKTLVNVGITKNVGPEESSFSCAKHTHTCAHKFLIQNTWCDEISQSDDSVLTQNQGQLHNVKSLHNTWWKQNGADCPNEETQLCMKMASFFGECIPLPEILSTYLFILKALLRRWKVLFYLKTKA